MELDIVIPPTWKRDKIERNLTICRQYRTNKFPTSQIANYWGISTSMVQRITRQANVSRTVAEANRLFAPMQRKRRLRLDPSMKHKRQAPSPHKLKMRRTNVPAELRRKLLLEQPYCSTCGATARPGVPLEIDHIDNDRSNSVLENLQVLCHRHNYLKWQAYRAQLPQVLALHEAKRQVALLSSERKRSICDMYKSGEVTTKFIAKRFGITPRTVQRIVQEAGWVRTRAEANRLRANRVRRSKTHMQVAVAMPDLGQAGRF